MNPEIFSSLPEGQWLLQQVQTAFPNCPANEQPDGVAILCTIRQTIGHPPLFRECISFFQQHPQHPWERWMLPFLCMNVSEWQTFWAAVEAVLSASACTESTKSCSKN